MATYGNENRLGGERSPYLLQHARNPVDWYPWGEEAFRRAREDEKPIFLSIGYSTCHWCHVMAHESFENESVARVMNENFVCIKIDREERPDIDSLYMSYVQAATGGGGWPMSVWLTPDRKPFMGGTYFPPDHFTGVLERIAAAWRDDRAKVVEAAGSASAALAQHLALPPAGDGSRTGHREAVDLGYEALAASFDKSPAGFGGAPRFPRPVVFDFLFRYAHGFARPEAAEMAIAVLKAMARGGMYDHLGGGFHRYSTDAKWHVPHFEKMLYDQAQLAISYVEAFQVTRDCFHADVARGILEYVLRDMTSPEGGFYSAEDADSALPGDAGSGKLEGAFYVWGRDEIAAILPEDAGELFSAAYGVRDGGNVDPAGDPRGELAGRNVLFQSATPRELAAAFSRPEAEIEKALAAARNRLLAARAGRPRPHLDDKILAAWNGLMISAFTRAAWALEEPRYLAAARRAANFILDRLYSPEGHTLMRRYRGGEAGIDGFLDDYAFSIQALLDLYEATGEIRWLKIAVALQETQDPLFLDPDSAGYFTTDGRDPSLIARQKDLYDGAEPAGNSVAALNLLRLARMTARKDFADGAEKHLNWCMSAFASAPNAHPFVLGVAVTSTGKNRQVVLAGAPDSPGVAAMRTAIARKFRPGTVVLQADDGEGQEYLSGTFEFMRTAREMDGKATAYVCEDHTCRLPTTDPGEI